MNPWMANPWVAKNPGPFKVGDRVSYQHFHDRREGIIVEDRGALGVDGRRIYALRVRLGDDETITELPVEELTLVASAPEGNGIGCPG